ncbi:DUF1553 domain-containing protein [Alienimonas chondri]|uniref:LamG-like jellyroll fold domain-containing protein n=1 Tax=Alienimonas chondri TaxID=2681879 RepID=A0ABX1VC11_9PLAN|nr:DUF1553 domain-containing protein [Alienimonas chondri]NNJ25417.1 hypothetical protein [Alienimonas chondri]
MSRTPSPVAAASVGLALLLGLCGGPSFSLGEEPADPAPNETAPAEAVSFNRDVRPILSDRCFHCHGPDASNQDSPFRLDTRENATADLGGYVGVAPGDLKGSELHARIHADDWSKMPPADSNRTLTDAERDILDRWIEAGAPFEAHWSFQPLPDAVAVPEAGGGWAVSPLDRFVAATHAERGLNPAPPAPPEAWLRRVTFDLTGLPPALAELDAFAEAFTTDPKTARAEAVDRLLASEAHAERLTAEWLDVARYSDSNGYQRDDARFVWPYRDWVLNSFRDNKPYDAFLTEQLAGDLLPNATPEQRLATAFNRLHSYKKEGGSPPEEFRVENVADRTHTAAAAFLGLTMECARCHDHKYDPITQRDYYAMSAFFANVEERGLISFFTSAVPTPAMNWPNDAQAAEIHAARSAVEDLEARLERVRTEANDDFAAWMAKRGEEPVSPLPSFRGEGPGVRGEEPTAERSAPDNSPESSQQANAGEGSSPSPPAPLPQGRGGDKTPGLVASLSFEATAPPPEGAKHETAGNLTPTTGHAFPNTAGADAISPTANELVDGRVGNAVRLNGDDAVVLPGAGHFERHQPFSFALWIKPPELTERGVIVRRSRGWDDAGSVGYELTKRGDKLAARIAHFWPGDALGVETTEPLVADRWTHVAVTYDGSSRAAGLRMFIDGEPAAIRVTADSLTRTIAKWGGGYPDLAIGSRYRDRGFKDGIVDEFRLFDRSLTPIEVRGLYEPGSTDALLAKPAETLNEAERNALRAYFLATVHEPTREARAALTAARERLGKAVDATPAITVMREMETPRQTYLLNRGAYDQPGEPVDAETPSFLAPFPEGAPRNRLGLANWLTEPSHPLTARVAVNRYWQLLFGEGLVSTPEDFGNQGAPPSHPELLDWLARDFVNHGWDVRRLLRQMALSATYAQDSVVTPQARDRDPENRWLTRGGGARLSAEMIRDNALAVSGLLEERFGGPPAKPYDVALAYTPLTPDKGAGLYRRSLYTFWKRTAPAPVMLAMNSGRREVCRLKRDVVQSPLQALVLLNGTQFVEASRAFAGRLLQTHGENHDAATAEAFRTLTSRPPTEAETAVLQRLYADQFARFEADPKAAEELLNVGSAPRSADLDPARHAALTATVNALMNLDESVRRP